MAATKLTKSIVYTEMFPLSRVEQLSVREAELWRELYRMQKKLVPTRKALDESMAEAAALRRQLREENIRRDTNGASRA